MLRVLLCDDQEQELQQLPEMVDAFYRRTRPGAYQLATFSDSKQVDFELEDQCAADVYILDIDMPAPSGIDLALHIHEIHPLAIVYFYTSHTEYATEGYRVEARRYLIKGGNPEYLYEALAYAAKEYDKMQEACISLSFYHDTAVVPIADIMYVTRARRLLEVHTHSQDILMDNSSVQDLFSRIGKPWFVFLDRSTFLNVDYVRRTSENTVTLFNGDTLTISRKRVLDVKNTISRHWKAR